MVQQLRQYLENNGFNVISRLSDRFGMRVSKLRLLYIYFSFATLGIGFVLYLFFAFMLWLKDSFVVRRKSVFDL